MNDTAPAAASPLPQLDHDNNGAAGGSKPKVKVYLTLDYSEAHGPGGGFRDLTAADAAQGVKDGVLRLATDTEIARRRPAPPAED